MSFFSHLEQVEAPNAARSSLNCSDDSADIYREPRRPAPCVRASPAPKRPFSCPHPPPTPQLRAQLPNARRQERRQVRVQRRREPRSPAFHVRYNGCALPLPLAPPRSPLTFWLHLSPLAPGMRAWSTRPTCIGSPRSSRPILKARTAKHASFISTALAVFTSCCRNAQRRLLLRHRAFAAARKERRAALRHRPQSAAAPRQLKTARQIHALLQQLCTSFLQGSITG